MVIYHESWRLWVPRTGAHCATDAGGRASRTCSWPTSHRRCSEQREVRCEPAPGACRGLIAERWVCRTAGTPGARRNRRSPVWWWPTGHVPPHGLQAKVTHIAVTDITLHHTVLLALSCKYCTLWALRDTLELQFHLIYTLRPWQVLETLHLNTGNGNITTYTEKCVLFRGTIWNSLSKFLIK